jgi:hypothetical protein
LVLSCDFIDIFLCSDMGRGPSLDGTAFALSEKACCGGPVRRLETVGRYPWS